MDGITPAQNPQEVAHEPAEASPLHDAQVLLSSSPEQSVCLKPIMSALATSRRPLQSLKLNSTLQMSSWTQQWTLTSKLPLTTITCSRPPKLVLHDQNLLVNLGPIFLPKSQGANNRFSNADGSVATSNSLNWHETLHSNSTTSTGGRSIFHLQVFITSANLRQGQCGCITLPPFPATDSKRFPKPH